MQYLDDESIKKFPSHKDFLYNSIARLCEQIKQEPKMFHVKQKFQSQ